MEHADFTYGYLGQAFSFPTRGRQARVLSNNFILLNKSVGSQRSELQKWERYNSATWAIAGNLGTAAWACRSVPEGSTCRSGPSMCRLCRCLVSGM